MGNAKDAAVDIFLNATGLRNLAAKEKDLAEAISIILDAIEGDAELNKKLRKIFGTDKLPESGDIAESEEQSKPKKYRYQIVIGPRKGEIFTDEEEAQKAVANLLATGCKISELLIKEEIKDDDANETADDADSEQDGAQP